MKVVCDLGKDLKLTKKVQTAKLVKHGGFIVLIHDNSKLILIQERECHGGDSEMRDNDSPKYVELDRVDYLNLMPNASITPINLVKGYFVAIGSRIQLYHLRKDQTKGDDGSYKIRLVSQINQVLGSQYLPHACLVQHTSKIMKLQVVFQILDRQSQEL